MINIKVFLGTDHRGVRFKEDIIKHLQENGIDIIDSGLPNDPEDDHPDFAFKVCDEVLNNPGSIGILVCGTGIGMSISANKVKGIYCAKVDDVDDAFYAKNHNGANVIALGIKHEKEDIFNIIDTFLATKGPSGEKYLRRIEKVIKKEQEA